MTTTLSEEDRTITYLGAGLDTQPGVSPGGRGPEHIRCERERLCEVVLALRALLAGATLKAKLVAGIKTAVLATLIERLKGARYAVILWAAGDLDPPERRSDDRGHRGPDHDLNKRTRCAGLPLGGNDGGLTAERHELAERLPAPHQLCLRLSSPRPEALCDEAAFGCEGRGLPVLDLLARPHPTARGARVSTVLLGLEAPRPLLRCACLRPPTLDRPRCTRTFDKDLLIVLFFSWRLLLSRPQPGVARTSDFQSKAYATLSLIRFVSTFLSFQEGA